MQSWPQRHWVVVVMKIIARLTVRNVNKAPLPEFLVQF